MRYLIIFLLLFSCASNYTKYGDRDKFVTNIESEHGKRSAAAYHCKQYNRYYVNDPNLIGVPDFHKRYLCIDELVFEGNCETGYGCKYYALQAGKKIKFEYGVETNGKKIGTYASARMNGNSNSAFTTTTSSSSSALNAIEHGLSMLDRKVYSDSKPILFYENSTNSMRKCIDSIIAGSCTKYAPYNSADYDFDTLFHNPKTGAMQKCLNEVLGSCRNFSSQANPMARSSEQLFYNPRTKSMSTCLNANNSGQCLAFGISPSINKSVSKKEYRGFQSQSKTNPYYFKVPETPSDLIEQGLNMLGGGCTLGRNC